MNTKDKPVEPDKDAEKVKSVIKPPVDKKGLQYANRELDPQTSRTPGYQTR